MTKSKAARAADGPLAVLLEAPPQPIYLVEGDRVLAEPLAERLGRALAERAEATLAIYRRPPALAPILADLCTYSLFGGAKVALAVECDLFADREAVHELLREVLEVRLAAEPRPLGDRDREAALRLLRALRLLGLDPLAGDEESLIAALPAEALKPARGAGRRGAAKGGGDERAALTELLRAARREGLEGRGDSDATQLADLLASGLPPGHALVLAESTVAERHPLRLQLAERGAVVAAGRVAQERGGWSGLAAIAEELERETGVGITAEAFDELVRRTLRGGGRGEGTQAESTARLAAEYRKLATLAAGGRIGLAEVSEAVADRGDEDVWKIFDAVVEGRAAEALGRLTRLLEGAEEPEATRLSFFALLAGFCRHLAALSGRAQSLGLPAAERHYARFKERIAPALQAPDADSPAQPLAGLHPFRLHRAYLLAARLPPAEVARLPWRVLETERRLKGDGAEPTAALAELLLSLVPTSAPR